jgi:hypothetical protein
LGDGEDAEDEGGEGLGEGEGGGEVGDGEGVLAGLDGGAFCVGEDAVGGEDVDLFLLVESQDILFHLCGIEERGTYVLDSCDGLNNVISIRTQAVVARDVVGDIGK